MEEYLFFIIRNISSIAIVVAAVWALFLFRKQQKFKRLQNLSSLWKEFVKDEKNMHLFNIMNEIESGHIVNEDLSSISTTTKLKYLALIEEVAMYVENFEVDKDYAKYLFQWHFYFVYQSPNTLNLFWSNLGGIEEMKASYWSKSRELSTLFLPQSR
ncbi:MAG: hypothetical protein JWQ09_534 [Segetibacter sp.]|nr:hypothetical protein [Segetibacter sp.]